MLEIGLVAVAMIGAPIIPDVGGISGDDSHGNNPVGDPPFTCNAYQIFTGCMNDMGVWPSHIHHCIECYEVTYDNCLSCSDFYSVDACIDQAHELLYDCSGIDLGVIAALPNIDEQQVLEVLHILLGEN